MRENNNGANAPKRAFSESETKERPVWEFQWRESGPDGKRHQRTLVIGSVSEFRTERDALAHIQALRININQDSIPASALLRFSSLVKHYRETELSNERRTAKTQ